MTYAEWEHSEAGDIYREGLRRPSWETPLTIVINWEMPPEYVPFTNIEAPLFRDAEGNAVVRERAVTAHPRPGAFARLLELIHSMEDENGLA